MKLRNFDLEDLESYQDLKYIQKLMKRKSGHFKDVDNDERRKQGKPRDRVEMRNRKQGEF
jgi:hypothetical protein